MKTVALAVTLVAAIVSVSGADAGKQHTGSTKAARNWMRDRVNAYHASVAQSLGLPAPASGSRIVGGTPVSDASKINVFQAALLNAAVNTDYNAQFCGGSLFRNRYIVTAAHCSDFITSPSSVAVLVGTRTLNTTGKGKRIKVTNIKIHPNWNNATDNADAAVWTLAEEVTSVKSVVLAARGSDPAAGLQTTTSGWGDTRSTPRYPTQLRSVNVAVVSRATCNAASAYNGRILPAMYCARAAGKDSCQGDSGGPATTNSSSSSPWDTLTGIVSFGIGCADPSYPGVYVRVGEPSIYDFIVASAPAAPAADSGWYQATKSTSIAARASFVLRSPTCPALRPKATACQASSNVFTNVDSAYPNIADRNATYATDCSCSFKNTNTAAATAAVRCAVYCAA